jgi:hypothetical protein
VPMLPVHDAASKVYDTVRLATFRRKRGIWLLPVRMVGGVENCTPALNSSVGKQRIADR